MALSFFINYTFICVSLKFMCVSLSTPSGPGILFARHYVPSSWPGVWHRPSVFVERRNEQIKRNGMPDECLVQWI